MTHAFLPYARQQIDQDDIDAVTAVLKSDYLTTGPATREFEAKLANVTGAEFAISCSSGTAALHLAAMALNLKTGDKVIVPSITFLATANAVRYVGSEVVFADVNPDSGLMEAEHFQDALARGGDAVKAVFPVHLGGQCANMIAISKIAAKKGVSVVEDACHAIGGEYLDGKNRSAPIGSCIYSDMAVFSFHPVKTIAMGEGGAVTAKSSELATRVGLLRNHGMTREAGSLVNEEIAFDELGEANPWYYEMLEPGFNYRASDIHCAIGLSQLKKLKGFVERRRNLVALYDDLFKPLEPLVRPVARTPNSNPAWHLYQVMVDFEGAGVTRAQLMKALRNKGVGSQVHYIPVHCQPYYRDLHNGTPLPGAEAYYAQTLSLPLFLQLADSDVERVVEAVSVAIQS